MATALVAVYRHNRGLSKPGAGRAGRKRPATTAVDACPIDIGRSGPVLPGAMTARAWQRMLSGRRLDLLDPSPLDIEIEDIAHGLARVARWNGQTLGAHPFSVAEHSLLVERLVGMLKPAASASDRLLALVHDAPEYVIGDMISPFKAALGIDYHEFEARLARAVRMRFSLPEPDEALSKLVKRADRASAFFEATQLAGFGEGEASRIFGRPRFAGATTIRLAARPIDAVQRAFLERFEKLSG